jgi:hypothetical protein
LTGLSWVLCSSCWSVAGESRSQVSWSSCWCGCLRGVACTWHGCVAKGALLWSISLNVRELGYSLSTLLVGPVLCAFELARYTLLLILRPWLALSTFIFFPGQGVWRLGWSALVLVLGRSRCAFFRNTLSVVLVPLLVLITLIVTTGWSLSMICVCTWRPRAGALAGPEYFEPGAEYLPPCIGVFGCLVNPAPSAEAMHVRV